MSSQFKPQDLIGGQGIAGALCCYDLHRISGLSLASGMQRWHSRCTYMFGSLPKDAHMNITEEEALALLN
jgi:hypothetical protein